MKKKIYQIAQLILYVFVFFLSVQGVINNKEIQDTGESKTNEKYDSSLKRLNSIESLIKYNDSLYFSDNTSKTIDTIRYVEHIVDLIQLRFKEGLARYSVKNNWILYYSNKYIWDHISAIVDPDDLMLFGGGLCSQQNIVFLEVLKRKKITFRTIGLGFPEGPGHFLCEVRLKGNWNLYDLTLEPNFDRTTKITKGIDFYLQNIHEFHAAYDSIVDPERIDKLLQRVEYGEVNQFPAQNMIKLHKLSFLLLWLIPILSGMLTIRSVYKLFK